MSSIQPLPKYFYRIHNKIISVDFEIPFLPKINQNIIANIDIIENKDIFNAKFKDNYFLNKDNAFYSKSLLIQSKHSKKSSIEYYLNDELSDYDRAFKLLSHPIALSLFLNGSYVLHSSAIEIRKKAYIFIGPSGSGKSYAVNSLLKYGRLMTEDILNCIYRDNSFYAAPSIPVIKLNQNELIADGKKFKIAADSRNRKGLIVKNFDYKNTPVKIEGCFILKDNKISNISKCGEMDAYRNLLLNSFSAMPKNKCPESEKKLMANIALFIKTVPIYSYQRNKDHNLEKLLKFLQL
tara:strand:- start:25236 stop:26117 length:882 start_codon:yes stop_codon:yes gene_type:complete